MQFAVAQLQAKAPGISRFAQTELILELRIYPGNSAQGSLSAAWRNHNKTSNGAAFSPLSQKSHVNTLEL